MIKGYGIEEKGGNVGFEWEEGEEVWRKVKEEIGEFEGEVGEMEKEKGEGEFGDVMLRVINGGGLYKMNGENGVEGRKEKFMGGFN